MTHLLISLALLTFSQDLYWFYQVCLCLPSSAQYPFLISLLCYLFSSNLLSLQLIKASIANSNLDTTQNIEFIKWISKLPYSSNSLSHSLSHWVHSLAYTVEEWSLAQSSIFAFFLRLEAATCLWVINLVINMLLLSD